MNEKFYLKQGDSGENVTLLQSLLKINNYYQPIITGVYGPDTEYFVSKFQKENNIIEENFVGPITINKLYDLTKSNNITGEVLNYPTIRNGDSNTYVITLKNILTDMTYYNGDITEYFDDELKSSVQVFQLVNNLVTDGIVGTLTWSSLIYLYSPLTICGNNSEDFDSYIVVAGDTLYKVATMYNLTVDELKTLNNLTSDTLSIGQILKISNTTSNDTSSITEYIVVSGDTLYSIANKFNTTVSEIKSINNLTSDTLSIGQILKITTEDNKEETYDNYTVIINDTLYKIATKYNITVAQLVEINNLSSDILSIGQILKVPKSNNITYYVTAGDTLYNIATRYNTTVDSIISKNNLQTTILSIGQILYI